jgi:hypothetical protein
MVYAQLVKNLENACVKARRYKLAAQRVLIFLRTQDFRDGLNIAKVSYGARAALESGFALHREV